MYHLNGMTQHRGPMLRSPIGNLISKEEEDTEAAVAEAKVTVILENFGCGPCLIRNATCPNKCQSVWCHLEFAMCHHGSSCNMLQHSA